MDGVAVKGLHRIEVRDSNGDPGQAVLEIRYRKIRVLPPIGKQKQKIATSGGPHRLAKGIANRIVLLYEATSRTVCCIPPPKPHRMLTVR